MLNLDDNFISGFILSDWFFVLVFEFLIVEGNFLSGILFRFLSRNLTFFDVYENLFMGLINEFFWLKWFEGVLFDCCWFMGLVILFKVFLLNFKMISLVNNVGFCGVFLDLLFVTKE